MIVQVCGNISGLVLAGRLQTEAQCVAQEGCMNPYDASQQGYIQVGCCLTEVPRDIPAEALEVHLPFNPITSIHPGVFSHLTQCTVLFMVENRITQIQRATFTGMHSLTHLILVGGRISIIEEGAFDGLEALQFLDLGGNLLSSLDPEMFTGLNNVEYLGIFSNIIFNIEEGSFDSLHSLRTVSLQGNRLTTLDPDLFLNLPRPLNMTLCSGPNSCNQWDCSSLCWLKHEEQHGTISFVRMNNWSLLCTALSGVQWNSLQCGHRGRCH